MDEVNAEPVWNSWQLRTDRRHRLRITAFFILSALPLLSSAQTPHPTEGQVKAAYLFNFGKFVTWQADQTGTRNVFEICILGKDPFGAVLDTTIAGESIGGRNITVGRLSRMQDASQCSELYISPSEESRLGEVLAATQRMDVLTVSDIPHFADRGGMIGLVKQQDRIRFEVNRKAAEQRGLVLSSELLKVATKVIPNGPGK